MLNYPTTEQRKSVKGVALEKFLDANGVSAAALIQKVFRSTLYSFPEWSTLSQAIEKENNKREVQRGTLAPRSALGEHTLYGVKYSVLYFTLSR